jgi:hypothetical protein
MAFCIVRSVISQYKYKSKSTINVMYQFLILNFIKFILMVKAIQERSIYGPRETPEFFSGRGKDRQILGGVVSFFIRKRDKKFAYELTFK